MAPPDETTHRAGSWWPLLGIALLAVIFLGVPAAVYGPGYLRYREARELLATGAPATGTIVGVRDTGNRFNDLPEVAVTVDVQVEGRPPWQATFIRVMDFGDAQFFVPGRALSLRYDPSHPERVTPGP